MKHDHDSHHQHSHSAHTSFSGEGKSPRAIRAAILLTVIFMVIELAGGLFANSLALISDAAHMLTDIGALCLSLFAIWLSKRPSTRTMSFGYHRAEILGALTSGILIWFLSGILIYEAVNRLTSPPEVMGPVVFIVATIGLGANLLGMRLLHSHKHENMNIRAAYLHMLADALGSVGAVVAGAVLWATGWRPIDPIITILFAALMLVSSWSLVWEALNVLMESTPTGVDPEKVRRELEGIPGVQECHDLHIWSVSSGRLALSAHLIGRETEEGLLNAANRVLKESYNIVHTTIQVEHPDKFKSERCYDCTPIELKRVK